MPPRPMSLEETGSAHVHAISVEEAVPLVQRAANGEPKVQIIDVRSDEEFASGHITGARHVPFSDLLESAAAEARAAELLASLEAGGAETVLVHCMYSQSRGPTVARSLASLAEDKGLRLEVALLEGGFHSFVNHVHSGGDVAAISAGDLVSNFNPERWRVTPDRGLVEADAVDAARELGLIDGGP
mmetsp:Transcript_40767/g.118097  ORF Transcript_40767/g.118097 Transcript_40767/m.118097 type:complete len:186 (-) Transcript_40767:64-621(-)